jgi:hypothetical protein
LAVNTEGASPWRSRIYPGEHGNPGRAAGLSYQRIADTLWQRGIRISHMTVKNVLDGKIKHA